MENTVAAPGRIAKFDLDYIALTPNGSKLVAVDSSNAIVSVFSPDTPASGQWISLRNANVPDAPPANQVPFIKAINAAITGTGKVFVGIVGWDPAEIDLSTMSFQFRHDTGLTQNVKFGRSGRNASDRGHDGQFWRSDCRMGFEHRFLSKSVIRIPLGRCLYFARR